MKNRLILVSVAALATVAIPAAAKAHVTLQPDHAAAGGFTRLDVRVPNERDNAGTSKVEVKFPPGFIFASYEPVPGWSVDVRKRKTEPVESHGETYTEEIDTITWTADGNANVIPPGAFRDFGLSVGMPDVPGEALVFPSIQTYENGEVVRWIGPEDGEEPAPVVTVTEAEEEHGAAQSGDAEADDASEEGDDDSASESLGIAALAVGGLGLLLGGASLVRSRRR